MAKDDEKPEEAKKGGKKKLIMMVVPVLLIVAGAAYFFVLKPSDAEATTELPAPVAGAVVQLDPITINLAGGHFLKLGMALQPTDTAAGHGEVSGAKALDLAIDQFSGNTLTELSTTKGREKAKSELIARVKLAYLPHDAHAEEEKSAGKSESSDDAEHSESSDDSEHSESATDHDAALTGEAAVKAAEELTVQPDIYDIYFTEFVMQ